MTYTASVEYNDHRPTKQHPYHLGTLEHVARNCVVDMWYGQYRGQVRAIALMLEGRIVDVFDGFWANDEVLDD